VSFESEVRHGGRGNNEANFGFGTLEHDVVYTSAGSLKGGPILGTLMSRNVGVLTYLRYDEGDTGFSSRNPMYGESDTLGGLAFDGLYGREHLPVITYRWSNGIEEEFPASWALPESDVMRAPEYFVQHEGRRVLNPVAMSPGFIWPSSLRICPLLAVEDIASR